MRLTNRNMQISILEINRKHINLAELNDLSYLFDSRHLKPAYMHVATELLMIKYGHEPTVLLGTTNAFE